VFLFILFFLGSYIASLKQINHDMGSHIGKARVVHYKKNVNYLQIITHGYGSVRKLVVTYRFYIRI